ncbi:hypothetical protein [Bradyrhizobium sp.]|uniref:hypothetical protein n=1 Tax=Bradyrhizobium sp. TaxID=376 RepID=UPI001D50FDB8|nr:hypothetical protein [Bradyrhizobium sp.]MBI5318626.1 hypothetical protein [Bradyrhizobium sp.]
MNFDPRAIFESSIKKELSCDFKDQIAVGQAVAVVRQDDGVDFYRIPLEVNGRVVGFFDVSIAGAVQRYGLQVTRQADIARRPPDILELAPGDIWSKAAAVAPPNVTGVGDPQLMSLGAPTKIAWQARMVRVTGEPVTVFVTPGYSWIGGGSGGEVE